MTFIQIENRKKAIAEFAKPFYKAVKVCGGYAFFESAGQYADWKRQK